MQCLNRVYSERKYCNRGQQHPVLILPALPLTLKLLEDTRREYQGLNGIAKKVQDGEYATYRATCNTQLVTLYSNYDKFHVLIRAVRNVNIFHVLTE